MRRGAPGWPQSSCARCPDNPKSDDEGVALLAKKEYWYGTLGIDPWRFGAGLVELESLYIFHCEKKAFEQQQQNKKR